MNLPLFYCSSDVFPVAKTWTSEGVNFGARLWIFSFARTNN